MSLRDEIKMLPTGDKEVRSFGFTFGILFLLFGGFLFWRHGNFTAGWFIAALAFPAAGYLLPALLRQIYKLWMILSLCMGSVMTHVILTVLYCLVITPIAIIIRISGKRLLEHGFGEAGATYWIPKPKRNAHPADYEKQF